MHCKREIVEAACKGDNKEELSVTSTIAYNLKVRDAPQNQSSGRDVGPYGGWQMFTPPPPPPPPIDYLPRLLFCPCSCLLLRLLFLFFLLLLSRLHHPRDVLATAERGDGYRREASHRQGTQCFEVSCMNYPKAIFTLDNIKKFR